MATHSSILAWRIPGMGEPGGLPSMGVTQSRTRLKRLSSSSSHSDYMKINIGVMLWAECVQSQNLYAEALTPNMMVLGGGAFGRQLDLHEIVKVLPLWR